VLHLIISYEPFEPADGDGCITFAPYAARLALNFLGANPPCHRKQVVISANQFSRREKITFRDELGETWYVDTDWTARDALRIFALKASLRFADCDLLGKTKINFFEVPASLDAVTLRHLLSRYRHPLFRCQLFRFVSHVMPLTTDYTELFLLFPFCFLLFCPVSYV
jgi:hypothetical protein